MRVSVLWSFVCCVFGLGVACSHPMPHAHPPGPVHEEPHGEEAPERQAHPPEAERPEAESESEAGEAAVEVEATYGEEERELWRWHLDEGETYGLQYTGVTDMTMSMGGMMEQMMGGMMAEDEVEDRVIIETDLDLEVERVLSDGRYDLRIPVRHLVIESATGERITLEELPEDVRVLRARMTPRGTLEFYERVMVEVHEEGTYAVVRMSGRADESSASSEVSLGVDGMELTARAEVDAETGRVELVHEVRGQEQPTRQVEEERPVEHVDVLPADVLTLLELPEEPIAPGDSLRIDTPMTDLEADVGPHEECEPNICGNLRIRASIDGQPTPQAMSGMPGMEGADEEMFAEMHEEMAMMGMGEGRDAMATMEAEVDATILFDLDLGQLYYIEGISDSSTNVAGLEMETATDFDLVFWQK